MLLDILKKISSWINVVVQWVKPLPVIGILDDPWLNRKKTQVLVLLLPRVKQQGLEWDAGVAGGGLMCHTTMPAQQ